MALDPTNVPSNPQRPGSSHSIRSVSRGSQRSTSRLSQRTILKQPRPTVLLRNLVTQLTNADDVTIQNALDLASKRIEQMKHTIVPDLAQIDVQFSGHIRKARINSKEILANALHTRYAELKSIVMEHTDTGLDISSFTLPKHLHFLLLLSSPPTNITVSQAETILTGKQDTVPRSQPLSWETILKEEPFEGQHWQGVFGLPRGSTVEGWEDERRSDSDDSSLLDDAIYEQDTSAHESEQSPRVAASTVQDTRLYGPNDMKGRTVIETLVDRQYWRSVPQINPDRGWKFDIGEPSTLGPTLDRILLNGPTTMVRQTSFLDEIDALREVLMILQGRQSCLFMLGPRGDGSDVKVLPDRRLMHLSSKSQMSILDSFATLASILNPLRFLVKKIPDNLLRKGERSRTFEAFLAAVGHQLDQFDGWCSEQEVRIARGQGGGCSSSCATSLLGLERDVVANMASIFIVLLNVTRTIESKSHRTSPSATSALILNALQEAIRARLTINDTATARALIEVWQKSTEPLWLNLKHWLQDGIAIRADFDDSRHPVEPSWDQTEFIIQMDPMVDVALIPDFWEVGYRLRSPSHDENNYVASTGEPPADEGCVPNLLLHVAQDILAAGKAVGLLRAVDMTHFVGDDWLKGWINFKSLTSQLPLEGFQQALEDLISDSLLPSCRLAQSWLRQVLVEDCRLWKHLQGMEEVCLMTRGDAMSHFCEILFTRMDSHQPWDDFHFLNTAFLEVTKLNPQSWVNPSLVRFTRQGNKDRSIKQTVEAIDGLAIEYFVPFPLTYLFGPECGAIYSSLFCFLLQIRRSKSVLDRILIRRLSNRVLDYRKPDIKVFYVLRARLSWFVNTILNFVMTNVIRVCLLEFHEALRNASSLDEMISCHRSHLNKLLSRCLLQPNTSVLHQTILAILDISLQFGNCLSSVADDTSLDVSRHSLSTMRQRHRLKGLVGHMRKPDMIGFAGTLPTSGESDSESEGEDAGVGPPSSLRGSFSVSLSEGDFLSRLDRMGIELDSLVRFVKRGVDSLVAGSADVSATFGVLAFYLEEWDL